MGDTTEEEESRVERGVGVQVLSQQQEEDGTEDPPVTMEAAGTEEGDHDPNDLHTDEKHLGSGWTNPSSLGGDRGPS